MSLTMGGGPFAKDAPDTVNYTLQSPHHVLHAHPFPRRVRAELGGREVLASERGVLLHETSLLPQLYVPAEDVRSDLLTPSDRSTHCPYKGDASYWHMRVGERVAENAVWAYTDPQPAAAWLRGLAAMYWDAADTWFDEDDPVRGHLRDPYHRVDTRPASVLVQVAFGDVEIARSARPKVLSETGLPNRYYLPPNDVRRDLLVPSSTRTLCPYKGRATYWTLRLGEREVPDVAWSYATPLKDGLDVRDHLCFLHEELTVSAGRS
ncbi:DUF427 domain-containing protein [Streptomonospora wellingtoniae]|uniref:DUF427 domain-containing protein n=1 Tax=Streptomonospora wellingtoniae TaxID=3075544 RepID=A0ABU2KZL3_9ACTN|nr:DUF427 domain-containing protein [Streptomonospora sp. DSM 45055]MDT0304739.1 DUF427 domain-containing protein [Streptomonospora sp. DSM 45055]